ncbi:MAG: hypothetical protein Q8O70_05475, partial [Burkholderiales bacterium]|nr:hypothetical protein [Burkholderiales bacterium]
DGDTQEEQKVCDERDCKDESRPTYLEGSGVVIVHRLRQRNCSTVSTRIVGIGLGSLPKTGAFPICDSVGIIGELATG